MAETIIDTRATSTLVLTRGNTGIVTATGEIDIASQDFAIDATDTTATVNGSVHSLGTAIILIRSTLNIGSNPEAKVLGGINAINGGVINNGGLIQGSSLIQGTGAVISGRFQALTINNTGTIQAINDPASQGIVFTTPDGSNAPDRRLNVTNSGTIKASQVAISGGHYDDTIINTGHIETSRAYAAISLGNGDDLYDGRNGGTVLGRIHLGAGTDTIYGGSGVDIMDGGTGADMMQGGGGNDTYYVDNQSDNITEHFDAGTDTLVTTVSITSLAENVENLTGFDTAGLTLSGNGLGNTIKGHDGNDVLAGGKGNDTLDGGAGAQDKAQFSGARSNYTVTQAADGTYVIQDNRDDGDGRDTLSNVELFEFSSGTLTLAQLLASDPVGGGGGGTVTPVTGKTLVGSKRIDKLAGGEGNDKLYGKAGKDVLTGAGGQDIFVFDTRPNTKTNLDRISDFSVAEDTIWLSDSVFKKLGKGTEASPAKLKKAFFKMGKAKDKNDYLVYNKKTGMLSYDADGSGTAKAVEIAKLARNLKLTQDDFFIV
jgi:Ca2+-binding RTX toxin-like protein